MKRFLHSIFDLSLVQQLLMIIVVIAISFIFFFTVYLRGSIDEFATNQMMATLSRSQQTITENIESGNLAFSRLNYDMEISHFLYENDQLVQQYPIASNRTYELLTKLKETAVEHTTDDVETILDADEKYYCRICNCGDNIEIVSIINKSYGDAIEDSLLNSVSNNCAAVFLILFAILMIWALSMIRPLHQIRGYIDKVKNGEKAELNVNRSDEIGDVAKALVEMNQKVKDEEEAKEEMIHNISHDLKTPIATIKSYAESVRDGIYPYGTMEASVDVIVENAERLEKKVYSLLYLNRVDYLIESGKDNDEIANISLVIEDVLMSLKLIRPEIRFVKDVKEEVFFKGDKENWRVVISNLVDNALRYAQHEIRLECRPFSLSVINDGAPISQDRITKLFKPFEKGDKGKFGLGLSICHKVCLAYGYDIVAENLEKGVAFRITAKNKPLGKEKKKNARSQ